MATFHYIALSAEHKELSGVIEAPDDQLARKKLNDLGLSVVSLNKAEFTPKTEDIKDKITFEFEGIDKNGKHVTGTIVAINPILAYGRLTDEYQLSVLALFKASLAPGDKEEARKLGVASVKQEYEKTLGSAGKKQLKKEGDVIALRQLERKELIVKVDATVLRIGKFLEEFGNELKNEEKEVIQSYVNQLIRIKDSTNLEHIKTTCERMLSHIQKQELFLHEEMRTRESAQLKIESQQMLDRLKQTGLKQEIDLSKTALSWKEKPFLKSIASMIFYFTHDDNPEILSIHNKIKELNHYIWLYIKMSILGKTKQLKLESWQNVRNLWEEKGRLKLQINAILAAEKELTLDVAPKSFVWEQIGSALGWILSFYLFSYVVAYPFTIKKFNLPISIPSSFYFYHSSLIKGVMLFLFISYCTITIRNYWLKRHQWAVFALYPAALFVFLLIAINLM
jgi:hypothetical protein